MTDPPESKRIKIDKELNIKHLLKVLPKAELFPRKSIEEIHIHLGGKCLCGIKITVIKDVLVTCNKVLSKYSEATCTQEELLLYTSMLSLFFEVSAKQHSQGYHCMAISDLVSAGSDIEGGVLDNLFTLLASEDKFISYTAGRAMTSLILILKDSESYTIFQKLASNLIQSKNLLEISHSLNIIQRIVDWKKMEEHPLEESDEGISNKCKRITISQAEMNNLNNIKASATKSLEALWPQLMQSLINLISDYSPKKEHVVVSFFSLWESILSVKANLSVVNIKVFYFGLNKLLDLLKSDTNSFIWKRVIDLYNEFLCYGSTLALQDASDESCNIAHLIIYAMKSKQFLDDMPWFTKASTEHVLNPDKAGDTEAIPWAESSVADKSLLNTLPDELYNKILLQKLVLLVLKAVALTVKETISESSSDDSSLSGSSDTEVLGPEMSEKNVCETLKNLDKFVKSKIPFHPETSISEWIIYLLSDQDDWLIEAQLCCLDIYIGSCQTASGPPLLGRRLNPHEMFSIFSDAVHFDHDVFLDFLVSNETCFLLYLLRCLKFLEKNWTSFLDLDEQTRWNVMTVLIKLRMAIERLVSKKLFPYDITPILRLLDHCEELCENSG